MCVGEVGSCARLRLLLVGLVLAICCCCCCWPFIIGGELTEVGGDIMFMFWPPLLTPCGGGEMAWWEELEAGGLMWPPDMLECGGLIP